MDEKQRISSDAFNIQVARGNTQYVYYIKNYSGSLGTGDLFVYNVKENESDKIASDVSLEFHVSTCGKYVYYYENPNTVTTANGSVTYGLLKEYSLKKEKAVKIGNDVVLNSLTSYNRNREILRNNCWFNTYQSTTKDSYTVNICYYSGKKPEAVVKEYEA